MIDKESRSQLAHLLRQLSVGQIANDQFEDQLPRSKDRAVREVIGQAWLLYDDMREHKLVGPSKKDRPEVARWILFLQTDFEYEWPSLPAWLRIIGFMPSILTLGLVWAPYRMWFERQGDCSVWPFLRDEDFKDAKKNPVFMSGAA